MMTPEKILHMKEAERFNASVIYSFEILDYLELKNSATLTELSEALNIHKSRILRLCGTMEHMGYLKRREKDNCYVLGSRLLSLGRAFERYNPLLNVLRPILQELLEKLQENILFQQIHNSKRLCICSVSLPDNKRYLTPEGSEANFPYGAASKVLLTWGPDELRAKVLSEAPYPRYTEYTITTAEDLLKAISITQEKGYAVSFRERTYGTAALDVPVFGVNQILIGSLGVAGTPEKMSDEFIEKALPELFNAAQKIQDMIAGAKRFIPKMPRQD